MEKAELRIIEDIHKVRDMIFAYELDQFINALHQKLHEAMVQSDEEVKLGAPNCLYRLKNFAVEIANIEDPLILTMHKHRIMNEF